MNRHTWRRVRLVSPPDMSFDPYLETTMQLSSFNLSLDAQKRNTGKTVGLADVSEQDKF